jgi:hypothetical protein
MVKEDLIDLLNDTFKPLGFKRKGNNWKLVGPELTKIVNLQKSQYSNLFYINYGYILNRLPLTNTVEHVGSRLGFGEKVNVRETKRICELLDFENINFEDEQRLQELREMINKHLVPQFKSINTEQDLGDELRGRKDLSDVFGTVLKHFGLEK